MKDIRNLWAGRVFQGLKSLAESKSLDTSSFSQESLVLQKPPKPEMGDIAIPLFPFAKVFRIAPQKISQDLSDYINSRYGTGSSSGRATAAGPYINIFIDMPQLTLSTIRSIEELSSEYGNTELYKKKKIMIEFSCPNTNKPLHLGHLRNDAIGESVARICKANGADVRKVNLINDRGVHICKSMLAYREFGEGSTPEKENIKSDHFVGKYYVKFSQWAKEDPSADKRAQDMLKAWEAGDPEVTALWRRMNTWAVEGIEETYRKTAVSFDDTYYESRTYAEGREEVLKGVEQGTFYKDEEGTVWADLSEIDLDKKVLLRRDGTSLYLTQDIGTAITRHRDWPFQELIYVVGSEQRYHFQVLFYILRKLGFSWADDLHHLSYGMVNLPEGKMKSREGKVVDADDLVEDLHRMAKEEIQQKNREHEVGDFEKTSEAVALAALNYYLLQVNPNKDMVFNPKESISFNGNTGPYLQYMGARISNMMKKFKQKLEGEEVNAVESSAGGSSVHTSSSSVASAASIETTEAAFTEDQAALLELPEERELIKLLAEYPDTVFQAGKELNPSIITSYLYELSKSFSRYYHDIPIMKGNDRKLVSARAALSRGILQVLKNAYHLVGIPFLESM